MYRVPLLALAIFNIFTSIIIAATAAAWPSVLPGRKRKFGLVGRWGMAVIYKRYSIRLYNPMAMAASSLPKELLYSVPMAILILDRFRAGATGRAGVIPVRRYLANQVYFNGTEILRTQ